MARKKIARKIAGGDLVRVKLNLRRGKSGRALIVDFGKALPAAMLAAPELELPKPRKTRYPIPLAEFIRRKEGAQTLKTRMDRRGCTVVKDRRGRRAEIAAAPMAAAAAPALPPAGALTPLTSFRGIAATSWLPPDCTMSVGPNHVMVAVNSSLAVYAKTGGAALLQRTLATWFANVTQGTTIFDPKLLFDQHAGRWVVLAVALGPNNESLFLISASVTSDPTGQWRNYALDARKDGTTNTNNWADYPGLGVDAHALYLTANMFRIGGNFAYSKIRIVPKAAIYSGGAVTFFDLVRMKNADNTFAFTVQPCHIFGAPQAVYFVNSLFPTGNSLTLWSLTNPLTAPVLTRRTVAVSTYDLPPDADQPGGVTPLDSGDVRILHAIFRAGSIWTALTTRQNWSAANTAAVHWFQIEASSGTLVQQGIFAANGRHFYYPALAPDGNGNVVLVFCASARNENASIYFTGRAAADPLGQLRPSLLLKAGTAGYVGLDSSGRNRWGDYSGVAADPVTGSTLWFYSTFTEAANTWGTWIGSARL